MPNSLRLRKRTEFNQIATFERSAGLSVSRSVSLPSAGKNRRRGKLTVAHRPAQASPLSFPRPGLPSQNLLSCNSLSFNLRLTVPLKLVHSFSFTVCVLFRIGTPGSATIRSHSCPQFSGSATGQSMEEDGKTGAGGADSSSRVTPSIVKYGDRQVFTVELRPGDTTIVSWKKLLKDANKVDHGQGAASAAAPSTSAAAQAATDPHPLQVQLLLYSLWLRTLLWDFSLGFAALFALLVLVHAIRSFQLVNGRIRERTLIDILSSSTVSRMSLTLVPFTENFAMTWIYFPFVQSVRSEASEQLPVMMS